MSINNLPTWTRHPFDTDSDVHPAIIQAFVDAFKWYDNFLAVTFMQACRAELPANTSDDAIVQHGLQVLKTGANASMSVIGQYLPDLPYVEHPNEAKLYKKPDAASPRAKFLDYYVCAVDIGRLSNVRIVPKEMLRAFEMWVRRLSGRSPRLDEYLDRDGKVNVPNAVRAEAVSKARSEADAALFLREHLIEPVCSAINSYFAELGNGLVLTPMPQRYVFGKDTSDDYQAPSSDAGHHEQAKGDVRAFGDGTLVLSSTNPKKPIEPKVVVQIENKYPGSVKLRDFQEFDASDKPDDNEGLCIDNAKSTNMASFLVQDIMYRYLFICRYQMLADGVTVIPAIWNEIEDHITGASRLRALYWQCNRRDPSPRMTQCQSLLFLAFCSFHELESEDLFLGTTLEHLESPSGKDGGNGSESGSGNGSGGSSGNGSGNDSGRGGGSNSGSGGGSGSSSSDSNSDGDGDGNDRDGTGNTNSLSSSRHPSPPTTEANDVRETTPAESSDSMDVGKPMSPLPDSDMDWGSSTDDGNSTDKTERGDNSSARGEGDNDPAQGAGDNRPAEGDGGVGGAEGKDDDVEELEWRDNQTVAEIEGWQSKNERLPRAPPSPPGSPEQKK